MKNIRIGIICPSEIAFRRFLPSLQKEDGFTYMGVAVADPSEWDGEVADEVIANEFKKRKHLWKAMAEKFIRAIMKSFVQMILMLFICHYHRHCIIVGQNWL